MALLPVAHKPLTGRARQFDGTLDAMLDIIGARPLANMSVNLSFDGEGGFTGLQLSGGDQGLTLTLTLGDWAIFPDNPAESPTVLPTEQALTFWQAV